MYLTHQNTTDRVMANIIAASNTIGYKFSVTARLKDGRELRTRTVLRDGSRDRWFVSFYTGHLVPYTKRTGNLTRDTEFTPYGKETTEDIECLSIPDDILDVLYPGASIWNDNLSAPRALLADAIRAAMTEATR